MVLRARPRACASFSAGAAAPARRARRRGAGGDPIPRRSRCARAWPSRAASREGCCAPRRCGRSTLCIGARRPRRARGRPLSMSAQLFPLDVLGDWNRLYGPGGPPAVPVRRPARRRRRRSLRAVHRAARDGASRCTSLFSSASARPAAGRSPSRSRAGRSRSTSPPARGGLYGALERGRRAGGRRGRAGLPCQGRPPASADAGRHVPRAASASASCARVWTPTGCCARTWRGGWGCADERLGSLPVSVEAARAVPSDTPRRVLVLGGTSEIAAAILRELAAQGPCEVALAGRDGEGLSGAAAAAARGRLRTCGDRGAGGVARRRATARRSSARDRAAGRRRPGDPRRRACSASAAGCREDLRGAVEVLDVNVVGAGSLLLESARALREQGSRDDRRPLLRRRRAPARGECRVLRLQGRARRARAGSRRRAGVDRACG